ncbi:MAG: lipoate--protein ligase, partial [Clostridia bacterium]|nr:lipoate--protein ligase [Clostridia bacterium]
MKNYLYISQSGDGHYNLGLDEWFLDNVRYDELILYFYVNTKAVIIGKNQNPRKECDIPQMRNDGV